MASRKCRFQVLVILSLTFLSYAHPMLPDLSSPPLAGTLHIPGAHGPRDVIDADNQSWNDWSVSSSSWLSSSTSTQTSDSQPTQTSNLCTTASADANDASVQNLIGIPQAGDIVMLSPGIEVTISEFALDKLLQQVGRIFSDIRLSSMSTKIKFLLEGLQSYAPTSYMPKRDVQVSQVGALLEACFEGESCMFYNTTTNEVVNIFRYLGQNNLTSTTNVWHPLAQVDWRRFMDLGLIFAPVFRAGAPGISVSLGADGMHISSPSFLRMYDAIR